MFLSFSLPITFCWFPSFPASLSSSVFIFVFLFYSILNILKILKTLYSIWNFVYMCLCMCLQISVKIPGTGVTCVCENPYVQGLNWDSLEELGSKCSWLLRHLLLGLLTAGAWASIYEFILHMLSLPPYYIMLLCQWDKGNPCLSGVLSRGQPFLEHCKHLLKSLLNANEKFCRFLLLHSPANKQRLWGAGRSKSLISSWWTFFRCLV